MMKRRALVLTTESARHPFRQSLPPHVFDTGALDAKAEDAGETTEIKAETVLTWAPDWRDAKFFFQSFIAFFTVAYSFVL